MSRQAAIRVEQLVAEAAERRPDHPALIFGAWRWTYAALRDEMDYRAALLIEGGLQPGDIVLTTESVTDDVAIAFLACCRAGLVLLYLSPKLTKAEILPLVARATPTRVFTRDGQPHPAMPLIPPLPLSLSGQPGEEARREAKRRSNFDTVDDPAIIQITSGTTGGIPKLACLPHQLLIWLRATPAWWETADKVAYIPRPHAIAARLMCRPRPRRHDGPFRRDRSGPSGIGDGGVWRDRALGGSQPAATPHRAGSPAARRAAPRLRAHRNRSVLLRQAAQRYNATVVQEYGSIEGGSMMGTPRDTPDGSIGQPYPGVVARIVDEDGGDVPEGSVGELLIHTPARICGYIGDPDTTARAYRDDWLLTGDLARRDVNGFYFLEGRRALGINIGGYKVAPEEVEAVLMRHPGVREAVVLAIPDDGHGEVVRVVIVPCGDPPSIGELRRYCRVQLASYKVGVPGRPAPLPAR